MGAARRFRLVRDHDPTGVSGTGTVADGIQWPDGTATVRWRTERASTVFWNCVEDAIVVHGHDGCTRLEWVDSASVSWDVSRAECPHCPDGHTLPWRGAQSWVARVGDLRDEDGQPVQIVVERSGLAHVAPVDAVWVFHTLNTYSNDR